MRAIKLLSFLSLMLQGGAVLAYNPPVGIPNPAINFGILDPIDTPKPDTKVHCPGWYQLVPRDNTRALGDARDAYYIDNTHPQATDSTNTYGRPGRPRKTVPSVAYAPGDYIEIHGSGDPATTLSPYTGLFNPRGAGTDENPIWFVGVNQPVFTGNLSMGGSNVPRVSYIVYDGLQWRNGANVELRPRYENNVIDHIVFRHCKLIGAAKESDSSGFILSANNVTTQTQKVQYVVLYDSEIANYGLPDNPNEECCIAIKFHVKHFWCLDSNLHHSAEDGIIMSHAGMRTSSHIYIGRNEIHENLTNGLDLKGIGGPVVISGNSIWGHKDIWVQLVGKSLTLSKDYVWTNVSGNPDFSNVGAGSPPYTVGKIFNATGTTPNSWGTAEVKRQISSGSGETCVFHYSTWTTGAGSYLNYPEDVSFLFNRVVGGRMGISTVSCGKLRIIGNTFIQTRNQPTEFTGFPNAIEIRGIKWDTWICHNTFYDCEGAIRIWDTLPQYSASVLYYAGYTCNYNNAMYVCINEAGGAGCVGNAPSDPAFWREVRLRIFGNIIANTYNGKSDIMINIASLAANSVDSGYNCIFNPSGPSFYNYKLRPGDITGNPKMRDPVNGDFSLELGSPCIDFAVEGVPSAYADLQALIGIDIRRDKGGGVRPHGSAWDIGAYEYGSTRPLDVPTNLKVRPESAK